MWNWQARMPCNGSATPHRCSTRSRNSLPACAAVRMPNECLPQSYSPTCVGSVARATTLGDGWWRDLLDNHDTLVRQELERFGGREVNEVGDGFVATFTSPSAVDAIAEAVCALGIEVRIGMHAGEVEVRGADVAGLAVRICARIAALAGPRGVLVSSTARGTGSPTAVSTNSNAYPAVGSCALWCVTRTRSDGKAGTRTGQRLSERW